MIKNILIDSESESIKREVTLHAYVYKYITHLANEGNKTKTKGTLTFEFLQFDNPEYDDSLVQIEQKIEMILESEGVKPEWFDGIADMTIPNIQGYLESFLEDNEDPYDKYENINIRILKDFDDSLSWSRGWSDRLGDAIKNVLSSGFTSRMDRIEAKQDLLSYLRNDIDEPQHEVIQGLIHGSDDYDYPAPLVEKVRDDVAPWELVDSFRFDDMVDTCGDMTQWGDRFEAIYNACDNESEEEVAEYVVKTWGIGQKYAEDKVSEFASEYEIEFIDEDESEEEDEDLNDFYELNNKLFEEVYRNGYSNRAENILGKIIQTKIEKSWTKDMKMYRFASILYNANLIGDGSKKQHNDEPKEWFEKNTTEDSVWTINKNINSVELD